MDFPLRLPTVLQELGGLLVIAAGLVVVVIAIVPNRPRLLRAARIMLVICLICILGIAAYCLY